MFKKISVKEKYGFFYYYYYYYYYYLRVLISHVRRQGNRPAYILAQYAENVVSYITWIEENPNMIESALAQDILFLSSS